MNGMGRWLACSESALKNGGGIRVKEKSPRTPSEPSGGGGSRVNEKSTSSTSSKSTDPAGGGGGMRENKESSCCPLSLVCVPSLSP